MIAKKNIGAVMRLLLMVAILSTLAGVPVLAGPPNRVRVLVAFKHGPGPAEQALVRRAGGTVRYSYHLVPAMAVTLPETAVAGLQANPNVVRVEPDLRAHAVDIELDNAWGVKQIGAESVHRGGNRGSGVAVAVVDSGVNYLHPDLDENYVGGDDFVEDDGDPMDVYGHGTHVAGTICGEDNDNGTATLGVVGVAPQCALYALRVLDDDGYGYASDLIAAMDWAVAKGIQVANLSLGWDRDPGTTVKAAFDNAWNAGIVTVAAAGNSGNKPGKGDNVIYPARWDSVIAVAATDLNKDRASFSSTGDAVELSAPGAAVFSTWNDETSYYSPQPTCGLDKNGEYGCYKDGSGTSMASPHVAGVAALVIASGIADTDGNGYINDEVRQRMNETADDMGAAGRDPQYGYGLVDADEAAAPSEPLTDIAITAVDASASVAPGDLVEVSVTVANVGNQDVAGDIVVTLSDDTDQTTTTVGSQTISGGLTAGASTTLSFSWDTSDATLGDHTLVASHDVSDADSVNDLNSTVVTVSEPDDPPTVSWVSPSAGATLEGTVNLQINAADAKDADGNLAVAWQVDDGAFQDMTYNATSGYYEATWESMGVSDGSHTLTARATDSADNVSTAVVDVTVSNGTSGGDTMYVADIAMSYSTAGPNYFVHTTVTIVDDTDSPLADATVYLTTTLPDETTASDSAITGSDGAVSFKLKSRQIGVYRSEVTDVTHTTLTYASSANAETIETLPVE